MEVSINGSRSSACHMQPSCNESVCDYKSRPSGESHHTKVYKLRPWSKLINGDSRDMVHFDETCVLFPLQGKKKASLEFCWTASFHSYDSLAQWVRCYPSRCPKYSVVLYGGGFTRHLHQMEYSKAASSD